MYHVSERLSSSRLRKCTCFGTSVKWTCSELGRSRNGLHDQKSLMKPASAVLREREGAFIMATNMTNSEAMVTSAASYTTYGCLRHQNIFTKTTLSKGDRKSVVKGNS